MGPERVDWDAFWRSPEKAFYNPSALLPNDCSPAPRSILAVRDRVQAASEPTQSMEAEMKRESLIRTLALSLLAGPSLGAEPPACTDPFNADARAPAEALRATARRCVDPEVRALYFNRAYHQDKLGELQTLRHLQNPRPSDDGVRYEQGRIFIALAEVFAESAWRAGSRESLGERNGAYDRIIMILESRLRGDDELARGGGLD
jgi:hypothetical protein